VEGTAVAKLKGAFMGAGTATAEATFKSEKSGPAFDIGVRIEEVDVTRMNDIFRAYGQFDASAGRFFFYSELTVSDGVVTGYVKPLFKDLKIYDKQQDKSKPVARKIYEGVVSGVAKILKNREREEVATKAEVIDRGRRDPTGPERILQGHPARVRPRGFPRRTRGEMTKAVRLTE